jgi:threonine dehydratase
MSSSTTSPAAAPGPSLDDLWRAAERIAPHAHRTPVLRSRSLDAMVGAELHFKAENFQRVGAFKFRGACNAVWSLDQASAERGVVTHSSGNHGQALALAARTRGIPAHIVMPSDTVKPKLAAVRGYGAQAILCEPSLAAREATCAQVQADTGATMIHPYADARVIAGQGTASLELICEVGRLDALIAPVSGGGLLSGAAIALGQLCPSAQLWGAEPTGADDAYQSLLAGELRPLQRPDTRCDGLRANLGAQNFQILRHYGTRVLTVSDAEAASAMRLVWERMKILIELSCATVVAALLKYPEHFAGQRVGVILSGGNVDLADLPWESTASA